MAKACQNIGKDFPSTSFSAKQKTLSSSKQRKSSFSTVEVKKSLKRLSSTSTSVTNSTKKLVFPVASTPSPIVSSSTTIPSFYFPPSPFLFDSFLFHQLNKTVSSSSSSSTSKQRSTYLMDSILSSNSSNSMGKTNSSFISNWIESQTTSFDGYSPRFSSNPLNFFEQFSLSNSSNFPLKYPSAFSTYFPSTFYSSINKL